VPFEVSIERFFRPEIAWLLGKLFDDKPRQMRLLAFVILLVDSVVANLGIS
jgi:hypothetical protein